MRTACSQNYQLHLIICRLCVTGSQWSPPGAGAQGAWGGPAAASGAVGCRAAGPLSPGGLTSLRKQSSLSLVISWMESKKVKANTARPLQSRPRKKSHKGSSVLPHWSKRVTGPAGIQRLRKTLPPHRKSSTCGQREERSAASFLEKSIYYPYQFPQILQIHEWR